MYKQTLFCLLLLAALLLTGCGAPEEASDSTPASSVSTSATETPPEADATTETTSLTSTPAAFTQSSSIPTTHSVSTPAATEQTSAAPVTDPIPVETTADDPWNQLADEWRTKTLPLEAGEDGRLIAEFVQAYFAAFEHFTPEDYSFAYSDSAVLSYQQPQVTWVRSGKNDSDGLRLVMPVRYALKLYNPWSWPNGGIEEGTGEYEGRLLCHHYFCFLQDENNDWRFESMSTDPAFYVYWGQPWHEFE